MLRLRGLAVVVLLTASSLLTLRLMGLSQWIQAILIIAVELSLGVVLHEMLENRDRRESARHPRQAVRAVAPLPRRRHPRPLVHISAQVHPHLSRSREEDSAEEAYEPRCRLLLPVCDDRPGLVEYALRECRSHRAELDLLFLRVPRRLRLGPKGPDDEEARGIIERSRHRAERAGVPFRALYTVTRDAPATIVAQATAREADLVVMAPPHRGRAGLWPGWPAKDDVRAVLDALPEHVGLLLHA